MRYWIFLVLLLCWASSMAQSLQIQSWAANLREAPGSHARVAAILHRGHRVDVEAWSGDWARVLSGATGVRGWVYAPAQNWQRLNHRRAPKAATVTRAAVTLARSSQTMLAPPAAFAAGDRLLEVPVIHELNLSMHKLDAEVLFRKEPHDRSSFAVNIAEDDRSIPGRVEVKGSFTRNFLKKSLLVKLERGGDWRGRKRFALNAMATDPSSMREWLAWDLIGALGMPSAKVDYVRLSINNRYIGLFLLFDWITDATFERHGLGAGGLLFHPDDKHFCGDLSLGNLPRLQECWFNLSPAVAREPGYAPLKSLVEELARTPVEAFDSYLEAHFNLDTVINWLVVNAITSNGDTYNKNYFLHRASESGRWSVVPWDYDLSFGRNADPVLAFPRNILNDNFHYLSPPDLGVKHALKEKSLQNPVLMERYRARMAHVLGLARGGSSEEAFGWFSLERFIARVAQIRRIISSDMQRERYRSNPPSAAQTHTAALRWYGLMRYHYLKQLLIEPSPFGTARWMAGSSYPLLLDEFPQQAPLSLTVNVDLPAGESWVAPTDAWLGRPLGLLHFPMLPQASRVRMEVVGEQTPDLLPPGFSPTDCIRRSWFLDLKTPQEKVSVDLDLDYLHQSSVQHELGGIDEGQGLSLWQMANGLWRELPTRFNSYANTLSVDGVSLSAGQVSRFVACTTR